MNLLFGVVVFLWIFALAQGLLAPPPPSPPPLPGAGDDATPRATPRAPPPVAEYHRQRLLQQQHDDTPGTGTSGQQPNHYATVDEAVARAVLVRPEIEEWELPTGYSRSRLGDQLDPTLFTNIVYDFQHGPGGLTALKDDDLQVCFIDHIVRPFVIPRPQRIFYTHTLPGTVIETEADREKYRLLVGPAIDRMCHHVRTYWLDNHLFYLYTSATGDDRYQHNPGSLGMFQHDEGPRTPPPVSLYRVLQQQQHMSQTFESEPVLPRQGGPPTRQNGGQTTEVVPPFRYDPVPAIERNRSAPAIEDLAFSEKLSIPPAESGDAVTTAMAASASPVPPVSDAGSSSATGTSSPSSHHPGVASAWHRESRSISRERRRDPRA